jgi:hypothetical protein
MTLQHLMSVRAKRKFRHKGGDVGLAVVRFGLCG